MSELYWKVTHSAAVVSDIYPLNELFLVGKSLVTGSYYKKIKRLAINHTHFSSQLTKDYFRSRRGVWKRGTGMHGDPLENRSVE